MKVKEIMTENPRACSRTSNLAEVAGMMWQNDCGSVPVVAEDGTVVGLITDRDICMAAALTGRSLDNIAVAEVSSGNVISCKADDDLRPAMYLMRENRVRRLAVLAEDGSLAGILSLNDLVLNARDTTDKKGALSYADVIGTSKAICAHPATVAEPPPAQLAAGA